MAGLFGGECTVCQSKDQFIEYLQDQVRELQKKLIEVASPGANARIAIAAQAPREKKDLVPPTQSHSPRRLAQIRQDKREAPEPDGSALIAKAERAIVEQSFERGNG
jgi:hypothetical protein